MLIHFHFIRKVLIFWAIPEFYDCSHRSSDILRCNHNWKICLLWCDQGFQNDRHQGDVDHHSRGVDHRNDAHLLGTFSLGSQFNRDVFFDLGSFCGLVWLLHFSSPAAGFHSFRQRKASQIMHVCLPPWDSRLWQIGMYLTIQFQPQILALA